MYPKIMNPSGIGAKQLDVVKMGLVSAKPREDYTDNESSTRFVCVVQKQLFELHYCVLVELMQRKKLFKNVLRSI